MDDLERDSHHKDSIIQEDDEVSTITWPLDLSNLEFYEEKVESNLSQNNEDENLVSFEEQNVEENPFQFLDFDFADEKDHYDLENRNVEDLVDVVDNLEVVESKNEHLIEEILNFYKLYLGLWYTLPTVEG